MFGAERRVIGSSCCLSTDVLLIDFIVSRRRRPNLREVAVIQFAITRVLLLRYQRSCSRQPGWELRRQALRTGIVGSTVRPAPRSGEMKGDPYATGD